MLLLLKSPPGCDAYLAPLACCCVPSLPSRRSAACRRSRRLRCSRRTAAEAAAAPASSATNRLLSCDADWFGIVVVVIFLPRCLREEQCPILDVYQI